jgi:RNA polymerase sigma-70 factor (ECF subfamily)
LLAFFLATRISKIVTIHFMSVGAHPASLLRSETEPLLLDLYQKSGAAKFGMSQPDFCSVLVAVAEKYLPLDASQQNLREFYSSLRVEELVLARCCAHGNENAWNEFFTRYRERLHDAALAITREDSKARELAGSIYAELYGTGNRQGQRISKLAYYNGRGSLEGWLRTVMAQSQVNEYRGTRRNVSLEEETEAGKQFAVAAMEASPGVDPRLSLATDQALASISAEDRCILAYYFLDDLTLAKIARILGVHESTISRRLERMVKALRKDILLRLTQAGMSRRQAEEALDVDVRDLTLDIRKTLAQESASQTFSKKKVVPAGEAQD